MTNLTDSTQKALVASSVEIGFLLAISLLEYLYVSSIL